VGVSRGGQDFVPAKTGSTALDMCRGGRARTIETGIVVIGVTGFVIGRA
jgi:hypothetical protein